MGYSQKYKVGLKFVKIIFTDGNKIILIDAGKILTKSSTHL